MKTEKQTGWGGDDRRVIDVQGIRRLHDIGDQQKRQIDEAMTKVKEDENYQSPCVVFTKNMLSDIGSVQTNPGGMT